MSGTRIIVDIVTTKNTLTILHGIFLANQESLQLFVPVFRAIVTLIHTFTHASIHEIGAGLESTGSKVHYFDQLRQTLRELSDAISTNNSSTISRLSEELNARVQQLRINSSSSSSSSTANKEDTADARFKQQLRQATVHINPSPQAQSYPAAKPRDRGNTVPRAPLAEKWKQRNRKGDTALAESFSFVEISCNRQSSSLSLDADENDMSASDVVMPSGLATPIKPRLMISYNHGSKQVCVDIYDHLTKDGYKVWIDFQHMHGNTLMAMARAIEDSDIIIYCVTESYSTSPNCQKEAEYAFVQKKVMVPLLLQSKYKPTGWLGFLLGASLYIDFTKNDFTQSYAKLKSEIETNAMRIHSNGNEAVIVAPVTPPIQRVPTPKLTVGKKSRSCVLF